LPAGGSARWLELMETVEMNARDIIVIGTSSGGLEALKELVAQLPPDFPATIFVVRHIGETIETVLPQILEQSGHLTATLAAECEYFKRGHIYCAPSRHHMVIEDDRLRLTKGPKENRFRPAVDPLFRSAALALGTRVVGVILTGSLDDGTAGLAAIKHFGGIAIVQDPREARYPSMPQSALRNVHVDYCLPLREIAPLLVNLANDPVSSFFEHSVDENLLIENRIAFGDFDALASIDQLGDLSRFTCPACHGAMREIQQANPSRFRCSTGHAYTAASLLADQNVNLEDILSNTLRALEENVALADYLREYEREMCLPHEGTVLDLEAEKYRAHLIQMLLLHLNGPFRASSPTLIENLPAELTEFVAAT
jgi:two-component system, chemotaxis family, protein-glutamate methylesterase/glutaminase